VRAVGCGALRGGRTESPASFRRDRTARDDQRESGRALTALAHRVRVARSAGLLDRRSRQKTGSDGEYAESAVVARETPDGRAAGAPFAADEGRHRRRYG